MPTATATRSRDQFTRQKRQAAGTLDSYSVIAEWSTMARKNSNPLAKLVRDAMDARGWTYADLAKACDLPRATVYALANKTEQRTTNRPSTLEKLASGLGLPLAEVRAAAAAGAGYGADDAEVDLTPTEVRLLAQLAEELSPAKRQQLLSMAQMFADEQGPPKRKARK